MKAVNLAPYWSTGEDWAEFLLVIVPAGRLPASAEELCRRVRAQVESDAVLYDLVTVVLAPPFEPTADWGRGFLTDMVESAMPDGHYFAPRGVVGVVVVAPDECTLNVALEHLRGFPPEGQMWARLFGWAGMQADPHAGVAASSVQSIAGIVNTLIERYGEQPRIALSERPFLGRIGALIDGHHLSLSAHEPEPAAEPPHQEVRPVFEAMPPEISHALSVPGQRLGRPERSTSARVDSRPPEPSAETTRAVEPAARRAPIAAPPPEPEPEVFEQPAEPSVARPARRLVDPVMYDGAEIVTVDQRTPIQKLTGQNPTDADCMDELQRDGRAVGLVYLVYVPDDGVVPRSIQKRRSVIAVEIDQALASVERDAMTDRPAHVAVEILSATSPVQKHGILRMAGTLTESVLPKVRIEYFSIAEAVVPLLDATHRTSRALQARGVEVASVHFVFLAAMRFPVDETTEEDWAQLLESARITWIDFGPAGGRSSSYPMRPSPFGLHVLSEKEDVVAVIKDQSEILYQYAPSLSDPIPSTEPAATELPVTRRWWPLGKRQTE